MADELLIRVSALSTFVNCSRRFDLEYIQGWKSEPVPGKVSAAMYGTAIHAGLAEAYQNKPWEGAITDEVKEWPLLEQNKVRRGMKAYMNLHKKKAEFNFWDVVEVEQRMTVEVGVFDDVKVSLTGQPDLIMRDEFGAIHIIDHKNTAKNKDVAFRYRRSALAYDWLWKQTHDTSFESFIFNVINRTKPESAPVLDELVYNEEMRDMWAEEQMPTIIKAIVKQYRNETTPVANYTADCSWMCPYMEVCKVADSSKSEALTLLETRYKRDTESSIIKKGNS